MRPCLKETKQNKQAKTTSCTLGQNCKVYCGMESHLQLSLFLTEVNTEHAEVRVASLCLTQYLGTGSGAGRRLWGNDSPVNLPHACALIWASLSVNTVHLFRSRSCYPVVLTVQKNQQVIQKASHQLWWPYIRAWNFISIFYIYYMLKFHLDYKSQRFFFPTNATMKLCFKQILLTKAETERADRWVTGVQNQLTEGACILQSFQVPSCVQHATLLAPSASHQATCICMVFPPPVYKLTPLGLCFLLPSVFEK